MDSKKLSFVGIQIIPAENPEENLKSALSLIDEALALHKYADVIVLSEYFYEVPHRGNVKSLGAYPEEIKRELSGRAKKYGTYIVAGTVANRREDQKIYNTSLLFDRQGQVVGSYDKIHLFDVLGKRESDVLAGGKEAFIYEADFGKIGIMVCYDIRFPELARKLALEGVEYLFVPSAFYSPRIDHWQDLIRATALQNSMYVTGVNLFGGFDEQKIFCGRSLIADPWGIPVATASDKAGFIQSYIDSGYPKKVREMVGSLSNRVPSAY